MKRCICIILCMALVFSGAIVHAAKVFTGTITYDGKDHKYTGTKFEIYVNDEKVETPIPPIVLENGRSLVPIREICEALGADVIWSEGQNGKKSSILICNEDAIITLTLDKKEANVNGETVELETAPKLIAYKGTGKTMVPVRFVSESLNMNVDYIADEGKILISKKEEEEKVQKTLTSLSYSYKKGKDIIDISFSAEPEKYLITELSNPTRLVVDFLEFDVDGLDGSYKAGDNIEKIRTGNFEGKARIVFDLSRMPEYEILLDKENKEARIILEFTEKEDDEKEPEEDEEEFIEVPKGAPLVIIDAGHGGTDPGSLGEDEDGEILAYEKDINLDISKKLVTELRKAGVDAVFTRETDVYWTLDERTTYANELEADLFVSIHCNAIEDPAISGTLVMHHTSNEYSEIGKKLAVNILKYLPDAWEIKDRGRLDGSGMYVIRKANMPSVIVENAFITNEEDREKLLDDERQQKAAEAIAKGILDTLDFMKQNKEEM